MHQANVRFEVCISAIRLPTHGTLSPFSSHVPYHVFLPTALLRERGWTQMARVGLLRHVQLQVPLECRRLLEGHATLPADPHVHPTRMHPLVSLQGLPRAEFGRTHSARIHLITHVHELVLSELGLIEKLSVADEALVHLHVLVGFLVMQHAILEVKSVAADETGVRLLAHVLEPMLSHIVFRRKATPTHITLIRSTFLAAGLLL